MAAIDLTRPASHAQLEEGSAEVFGAELQRGVSVNVAGQKLAVSVDCGAFSRPNDWAAKIVAEWLRPSIHYFRYTLGLDVKYM